MLEEVLIGLTVALLATAFYATFRVRQLYVVVPQLFSNSSLSTDGRLVEVNVLNKARMPEIDVRIGLDPALNYDIVASNDDSPILNSATISIPRIPPGDKYSILLLVEGGDFGEERISTISSTTSKGKRLKTLEEVPPNYGFLLSGLTAIIAVFAIAFWGLNYYLDSEEAEEKEQRAERLDRLSFLDEFGWSDYEDYSESQLRNNYGIGEFPIHIIGTDRQDDLHVTLAGRVVNESAAELNVRVFVDAPYRDEDPRPWESTISISLAIPAKGDEDFEVRAYWPKGESGNLPMKFWLEDGVTYILLTHKANIDK